MIYQIIELNDLENHNGRTVDSYSPFFVVDEIQPFGTEFELMSNAKIKHYLIIEVLDGYLYYHDILKVKEYYYPISTKVKTTHFTIRKNYTFNIEGLLNHLLNLDWTGYFKTPSLPIQSLFEFLTYECMDETKRPIPEDIFMIYEHSFEHKYDAEYGHYDSEYERDSVGYIDSMNLVNRYLDTIKLMFHIRNRTIPKQGRNSQYSVQHVTDMLDSIAKHKLPHENRLCIWQDLDQIIRSIGIHYPSDDFRIDHTCLSYAPILENKIFERPSVYISWDSKMTLANLSIKDFLSFCDLFLPMNCEVVFEGNTCKKFTYNDEYFYTYFVNSTTRFKNELMYNLNLMNVPYEFHVLLSNLLAILSYKTGLEKYQHKLITKLNDNKVKLELGDKNGNQKVFSWDLTLLHITDPIQFGVY